MGWETSHLGEVCDVIGGGTPAKNVTEYYQGNIPWATVRDMRSEYLSKTEFKITEEAVQASSTKVIPKDNVIIATRVGLGKVCFLRQDTAINQDLRALIPKSSMVLDRDFLFWWLKSVAALIEKEGTGATVKGVKLPFIKSLPIPTPALSEQKQIVSILDGAFADIDGARELAERNLNNAHELFGNILNQIFSQRGEGWKSEKFGDVCEFVRGPFGGSLKKNIFKPDGYAVYEQQHAINDQFTSIRYFIDEEKFNEMKRFELLPGDLIMSCSGTMGKIAIVPEAIKPGIINQALLKLSPSEKINRKFLRFWMQSNDFQHKIEALAQGAAIRNMASVKILKMIDVPIASPQQQAEIVERLEYCGEKNRKLEMIYQQKITALDELKQSLLQKAFRGKLTSKDVQAA